MATKQQWQERIEIIQAWIDESDIQLRDGTGDWEDYATHPLSDPSFLFDRFNFRIKPKPREVYFVTYKGTTYKYFYDLKEAEEYCGGISGTKPEYQANIVKYREVLEDE